MPDSFSYKGHMVSPRVERTPAGKYRAVANIQSDHRSHLTLKDWNLEIDFDTYGDALEAAKRVGRQVIDDERV